MRSLLAALAVLCGSVLACSDRNVTSATASLPRTESLQIPHACGFQVALSNEDESVGLILEFEDPGSGEIGNLLLRTSVGPGRDWSGRLVAGADLFSNFCDDAVDETEPTPVVLATWTLVDGDVLLTEAGLDGESVEFEASALVVEHDGERVELAPGPVELVNPCWGCVAG